MNAKKIALAAVVLSLSAMAQAQWAVYDYRVDQGVRGVVDAVRGASQTSTATQVEAAKQTALAVADHQTTMEIVRMNDRYLHPSACDAIAAAQGTSDANRIGSPAAVASGRGRGIGRIKAPDGVDQNSPMLMALQIAEKRVPAPSPEVQAAMAARGVCGTFVRPGTPRGNTCVNAGLPPESSTGYDDADIDVSTLIDGPQKNGQGYRKKLTIDSKDGSPDLFAVAALRRNLNTPIELRELTSNELKSEAGRQYMVFKDANEARMSVAEYPVRSLIMNRSANLATKKVVEQLLSSDTTGAFTQDYLAANYPNWKTTGISRDELMNLEVERRYLNEVWHLNIAGLPGEPIAKEQLIVTAFQNTILWRMAQSIDQTNLLLGQIAGTATRQEMTPQLNALHRAAAR